MSSGSFRRGSGLALALARMATLLALTLGWPACSDDAASTSGPHAGGSGGVDGGAPASAGESGAHVDGQGGSSGAGNASSAGEGGERPQLPAGFRCDESAFGDGLCDCGCGARDRDCAGRDLAHCEVCDRRGSCSAAACPGLIDPNDVWRCLAAPAGFRCGAEHYGDGICDCGCGARDRDCLDGDASRCENCALTGSCAHGACAAIDSNDNARCAVPSAWLCDPATYGDGKCHCGCGVVDIDCPDDSRAACQVCDATSCSPFGCEVFPDDNAHCPKPPSLWSCSDRLYHDGVRCDCGCGAVDPDCATSGVESCEKCDAPGSCSAQPCPSFIDPASNALCYQPDPPPAWTCPPAAYADGNQCDCGCSVPDPDCRSPDFGDCSRCVTCGGHGVCEGHVLLEDTTQCAPPPSAWLCSAEAYRDAICDCGCGLLDAYCQNIELRYVCGNYPVEGCSGGHRALVDANHNYRCVVSVPAQWTCDRTYYFDGFCDCGCGVLDLDCAANDVSGCDECDGAGSCSAQSCPGRIAPNDIAHCAG